jgi:uncharacterized protein YjbI with pentapeptide repeats
MTTVIDLIRKLRSSDNRRVLEAIEELRVRGWLSDGSLENLPFCNAQLQDANLSDAHLVNVDLHQAHMERAQLCRTNLSRAKLNRANLRKADFSEAVLSSADMFKADLQNARNLTPEQLSEAKRLWGAVMPDGTTYDGRYNLEGDLEFAKWGRVDLNSAEAMAEFLRVPLETYERGQRIGVGTAVDLSV